MKRTSCLVKNRSKFRLSTDTIESILEKIASRLRNRVQAAYIFGSVSTGEFREDSDIDLIIVDDSNNEEFISRAMKYCDLTEAYPNLDILVYHQSELDKLLASSDLGFWKSVKRSMRALDI